MFHIPGGGFIDEDGSDNLYGADLLMNVPPKKGKSRKMIFVTHDYRVGPFGYLNIDEPGYTGNMGFKDQEMAFNWIYDNIEFFGGNKDEITILGQSAGELNSEHLIFKLVKFTFNVNLFI